MPKVDSKIALGWARQHYVKGLDIETIAVTEGVAARTVRKRMRLQIPQLVAKEQWSVAETVAKVSALDLPIEMKREVVRIYQEFGLEKAADMTGCSRASISNWGAKLPKRGQLSFGDLKWKGAPSLTKKTVVIQTPKRARRSRYDKTMKREAVHRTVNCGVKAGDLAKELGVSKQSIYQWRHDALGNASSRGYAARKAKLAKEMVETARTEDQNGAAPLAKSREVVGGTAAVTLGFPLGTPENDELQVELEGLDLQLRDLQKDRDLAALRLENNRLRALLESASAGS